MTHTEKRRAEKKADTALCKLQDLFMGYNVTPAVAAKLDKACDAVREVITAIENTEAKPKTRN